VIDPSGRSAGAAAPLAGRTRLVLVPGRAFGTGEHPTTRLAIEALERHVTPGSRWLDLGCGSGILSLVASCCGAAEVLALDVDPVAVRVARAAMRRNPVGRGVVVRLGTQAGVGIWDGVVSNISATHLCECAAQLARLPRPGGTLVVSGFVEAERDEVWQALERAGLRRIETRHSVEWCLMVLARPPDGAAGRPR